MIWGPGSGGPRGGRDTPGEGNVAPLGARGETTEGYLGSVAQISEHQYLRDLVAKDLDTFGRLRP